MQDSTPQPALNRLAWDYLAPVSLALAALSALFAVAHYFLLPLEYAARMALLALLSSILLLLFARAVRRSLPRPALAHMAAFGIVVVVWLNSYVHLWLSREPFQATNLMLLIVGAGVSFFSRRWLTAVAALCMLSWAAAFGYLPRRDWMHYAFAIVSATALAFIIQAVRIRGTRRLMTYLHEHERAEEQLGETNVALQIAIGEKEAALADSIAQLRESLMFQRRSEATLRATEKLAATGRLAATLAHEINNPLASVTNTLYLLQQSDQLDGTDRGYVEVAARETARVSEIVRRLLGFYRDAGTPTTVDIAVVVDEVLALYAPRLRSGQICVETRVAAPLEVAAFPGEVRQIISNLVVNAIDALEPGGKIVLRAHAATATRPRDTAGVRLVIADSGPGIPPHLYQRVFEPFFTTKGEKGTGLGLWVTQSLVARQGGSIQVRSRIAGDHRGTCFAIFFPARQPERRRFERGAGT